MSKTFYIVDCSYYFRASYFALPPLYCLDGRLINAVYGFVSTILKLILEKQPDILAIADDTHKQYFRHSLLPTYKSKKMHVPEECNLQIPILEKVIQALEIPYIKAEGFEADDIIATLVSQAQQRDLISYICSKDKDLKQLLNNNVMIVDIKSWKETTQQTLIDDEGIHPKQVPDFLALTGDKADSIPGIPGIGPKIATRLLSKYETLENILYNYQELGGKLSISVKEHEQEASLAKQIAMLRTDVPLTEDITNNYLKAPHIDFVESIFHELGLGALINRVKAAFFSDKYISDKKLT